MPIISCCVSDDTLARLQQEAGDLGRKIDDLAECAIEESVRLTVLRPPKPVCSLADDPNHDDFACPICRPF